MPHLPGGPGPRTKENRMSFVRFLPHALIIAVLCFVLMTVTQLEGMGTYLVSWAIFQTWALYFMAGANLKAGAKAAVCYILGGAASVLIFRLTGALGGGPSAPIVLTLVASSVAFVIICLEKVPAINFIPGYFIGAGTFFALASMPPTRSHGELMLVLTITVLAGGLLGWLTVVGRTFYGKWLAGATAEEKK